MARFVDWIRKKLNREPPILPIFIQVAPNNSDEASTTPPSTACSFKGILHGYFGFLYGLGLTPLPVCDVSQPTIWGKTINKAMFGVGSLLAILHSVDGVKYYSAFVEKGNLDDLLIVNFYIIRWCIKMLFIFTVSKHWTQIQTVIALAARLEQKAGSTYQKILPKVFGITFLIRSILQCIFASLAWETWSPHRFILQRSYELACSVLLWGGDARLNGTMRDDVAEQYGRRLTATTGTIGMLGILLDFCGFLHFYGCWYLMLTVAVSLQISTSHFWCLHPSNECWIVLKDIQFFSRRLEDILGIIFKLLHLNNTMVFAYFLFYCFIKVELDVFLLLSFLDVVLILVVYYVAWRVAETNVLVKQYILDSGVTVSHIEVDSEMVPIKLFLKRLKFNPVGVGKGNFFIDDAFVLKFLCVVGSYFAFMEQRHTHK